MLSMRWDCLAVMAAVLVTSMIVAPPVEASGPAWAYAHPDSKVLIGIDWQRAKASLAGQLFRKQLSGLGGVRMDLSKGFDLFETVDRILISSPGELSGNASDSPMLIVLEGKSDTAALRQSMIPGTAVERFRGVDLLIPPPGQEGQDLIAALVNDHLTLIGDRPSIESALVHGAGILDPDLRARAQQMAAQSEIWMIALTPPMKAAPGDIDNPLAAGFDDLQSMDLGVSLAQGLGLKMTMEFTDAASAQRLALGAQMLTTMFMGGGGAPPEFAQIARGLHIEQTGATLRMNIDVPLDLLEKGMLQARSGIEEAGPRTIESLLGIKPPSGAAPAVRPSVRGAEPVTPAEPVTRTIRIIGLEEGVREIPYTVGGRRP